MATIFYYLAIFAIILIFYTIFSRFEKSYKNQGKGTVRQKTVFSIKLLALFFIPYFVCQYFGIIEFWFDTMRYMIFFMVFLELYSSWKSKGEKAFATSLIILTFFAFVVFPLIGENIEQKVNYFLLLGVIVILQDCFMSLFGRYVVKRLPDGFYKMKYPGCISPNKTVLSVILGLIANILLFTVIFEIDIMFVLVASIGTALGDALFSLYKRIAKIEDFSCLLGPIGGFADRFDGWVFAIILVEILHSIQIMI